MGRRKRGQRMRGPMIFENSCRKEWSGSGGFPGDAVSSGGLDSHRRHPRKVKGREDALCLRN